MSKSTVVTLGVVGAVLSYWTLTPVLGLSVGLTYLVGLALYPLGSRARRVSSLVVVSTANAAVLLAAAYVDRVGQLATWHHGAAAMVVISYTTLAVVALIRGILWVLRAPTNESEEADSPPTNRVGGE